MDRKHSCIVMLNLSLLMIFGGCVKNTAGAQSEFVLGTFCRIDLFENGSSALYKKLFSRLRELELVFSANRDDSELAGVNQNAGIRPVEISPELFTVLDRALYFAEATNGAFDPTVGPLVKLWGIGTETPRVPQEEEISAALDLVNFKDLEISAGSGNLGSAAGTAFLKRQGMALDLGAIAKGYAADELVRILQEEGIPRALIDLGGNIYIWGRKDKGEPWRIGVQDPFDDRGSYAGVLELEGSISVVSSGVYERFFISGGKQYHHIMELSENGMGRRGCPVENGLLSVTVIAVSSMDADALSTSCFVLSYEESLALAAVHGAEAIYIEEKSIRNEISRVIKGSPGAMAKFSVTGDFKLDPGNR